MRRVVLGFLGLALLAGCVARQEALPDPSSTTASTWAGPTCPKEGVSFRVAGSDAAMGLRVLTIDMVNCGRRPYTVNGYPSVRLFDEEHEPIEVAVLRGSGSISSVPDFDNPPSEVTLRPGEKARSGLLWRNLVTDATVDATTASYLEAAPAEGRPWQQVPNEDANPVHIDLGNTGQLGVQAWHKAP